tara:strand:- start:299 stop:769 length:471 start_codon:yes stop_codon:yes gene_type:complete
MDVMRIYGVKTGDAKYHEQMFYGTAAVFNVLEREVSVYLRKYKLSPAKYNALMLIKHQAKKEGIRQIEICKQLIVTASNMTRLLDKLEKDKFIERFPHRSDRRVNLILITKKGSDLLDQVWPGYVEKVKKLASKLPFSEQKSLSQLLLKWFSVLNL